MYVPLRAITKSFFFYVFVRKQFFVVLLLDSIQVCDIYEVSRMTYFCGKVEGDGSRWAFRIPYTKIVGG